VQEIHHKRKIKGVKGEAEYERHLRECADKHLEKQADFIVELCYEIDGLKAVRDKYDDDLRVSHQTTSP